MRVSHTLSAAIAVFLLLLALFSASADAAPGGPPRKIKMSEVTSLLLRSDMYTTGRRSAPVKQSVCVEGPCQFAPLSTLCTNSGFDGTDAVWTCQAEMPNEVRFGNVAVNCEGFDYPDDPYILEGSCGLEYQLRAVARLPDDVNQPPPFPAQQQQQQQAPPLNRPSRASVDKGRAPVDATDDIVVTIVAWIIIIAILCCIVCLACHGIINGEDGPSSSAYVYSSDSSSSNSSSGTSTSTAFGATKRR